MVSYGFVLKWNMQTGIHLVFRVQLASDKTKTQMLQITSNLNKLCYPHLNESTLDNRHNETRRDSQRWFSIRPYIMIWDEF